jgi:1-acyl-sn-glycerol-3-phosphate acyltransferase
MTGSPETPPSAKPPEVKPPTVEPLPDHITPFIRFVAFFARTVMRCLTRVTIEGAVDRIPQTGALIIASNHLSNADGVIVGGWLTRKLGRRIHWLGKREMLEWPLLGPIARSGSVHPVDRGAADVEAFRLAQRILDEGHVLMVFPEGTRSPTGGLQEAKDGLALLALRSGAPILPIGVFGTDRFWPRGAFIHPGGRIGLRVGEAFLLSDILPAGVDRKTAKRLATTEIMSRIAAVLPERHRGVYGAAGAVAPPSDAVPPRTDEPAG